MFTRAERGPLLVVVLAAAALGYRMFHFISVAAVDLLFLDQWAFLGAFFRPDAGFVEMFRWKHGPHREGLALIIDYFLYRWTGWDVRSESYVIGAFIAAAMVLAVMLKRRLFGTLEYFDIAIPVLFLTLVQYETLIGTPNLAYSAFPLFLMMVYCLGLCVGDAKTRYGIVLASNFLLIYSGFGLFMGIVTILVLAAECGWAWQSGSKAGMRQAGIGLGIAAASFGSFFYQYVLDSAVSCFRFPDPEPWRYGWFVFLLFGGFIGLGRPHVELATVAGAVLTLLAGAGLLAQVRGLVKKGRSPREIVIAVMFGYSFLFAMNAAIGRVCLGMPDAAVNSSRYLTLMIPAMLALYFCVMQISERAPRGWLSRGVAIGFLVVISAGFGGAPAGYRWFTGGKTAWRDCFLKTPDVAYCDSSTKFPIYPDRIELKKKLDYLQERGLSLFNRERANTERQPERLRELMEPK